MKRILLTFSLTLLIFSAYAQTTQQEYNFLTKDYAAQTAKGLVPELDGYYLEDLLELSDKTGLAKLLYKNDQASITPVATQFHIYDNDRTFYICIPHEKSSKNIYTKYQEDIQNIFKSSTNAQSIFSVVMVQYPIELQKYFDEIRALEKAYATKNESVDKKSNVTAPDEIANNDNLNINNIETKKEDNGAKVVQEPQRKSLVVKDYENRKEEVGSAKGKMVQKISGGLKKRKLTQRPAMYNPSGKTGTVKINICVDNKGKVVKTSINKKGTTTKDNSLISTAMKFAQKYKFNRSSTSRQCGFVTIEYK